MVLKKIISEEIKINNHYTLPCGHQGRIIQIFTDGNFVVKTVPHWAGSCNICTKHNGLRKEPMGFIFNKEL